MKRAIVLLALLLLSVVPLSATATRFMFEATISAVDTGSDLHNNLGVTVSDAVRGTFAYDLTTGVPSDFDVTLAGHKIITITGSMTRKYTDFTVGTWTGNLAPYDGTVEAFMVDMNFHRSEFRIRDSSGTVGKTWVTSTQYITADITKILPTTRIAPWKFIPSMTQAQNPDECNGGSALVEADIALHANYDLVAPTQSEFDNCLGGLHSHTAWRNMKFYNPKQIVCQYQNGPAMYTISPVLPLNDNTYTWIDANHGPSAVGTNAVWVAVGVSHGTSLIGSSTGGGYDDDREMNLLNPDWLQYWKDNVFNINGRTRHDFGGAINADGLNCIFSDNSNFMTLPMYTDSGAGGSPRPNTDNATYLDTPTYITGMAAINNASFHAGLIAWVQDATTSLLAQGAYLVPNWCFLNSANGTIGDLCWAESDLLPVPPFAGMAEGVYVTQGGHSQITGTELDSTIAAMAGLIHTKVLFDNTVSSCHDLSAMSGLDYGPLCGENFWSALMAFLEGFNPVFANGYFGWGDHTNITWQNELDPDYLHLGDSVAPAAKTHNAWIHEFTDGFVVLNALNTSNTGITTPAGAAYRCNHSNFTSGTNCGANAVGGTFNLARNEGIILLKTGKSITNSDNHLP